jgi:hypothetical protein
LPEEMQRRAKPGGREGKSSDLHLSFTSGIRSQRVTIGQDSIEKTEATVTDEDTPQAVRKYSLAVAPRIKGATYLSYVMGSPAVTRKANGCSLIVLFPLWGTQLLFPFGEHSVTACFGVE